MWINDRNLNFFAWLDRPEGPFDRAENRAQCTEMIRVATAECCICRKTRRHCKPIFSSLVRRRRRSHIRRRLISLA